MLEEILQGVPVHSIIAWDSVAADSLRCADRCVDSNCTIFLSAFSACVERGKKHLFLFGSLFLF